MPAVYDRVNFDEYIAELAGTSRDRAMRPAIEHMVRQFFRVTDDQDLNVNIVMSFFSNNPTVVMGLNEPGYIWYGAVEVQELVKSWVGLTRQTIPKIIIVDRGRIACHTVRFSFNDMVNNPDQFTESHDVVVMDLDKDNRIERLEYRSTTRKNKVHKGGPDLYDAFVKEVEEDAIDIDHLS